MFKYAALALIAAVAMPVAAQTPAPQPSTPPAAKEDPLNKVVCRKEESLGSRLNAKRVCLTVREWKDMQDANREAFDKFMQHAQMVPESAQ